MKKILFAVIISLTFFLSLFYFDMPFNLIKPVFHADIISKYAALNNINPLFITAIIKVESKFFRKARSEDGAVGLMQVMPQTASQLAKELNIRDFELSDLENPDTNIMFGSYYLSKLLKEFKGNERLAAAAYNAGDSKVLEWLGQNPMLQVDSIDMPYPETKYYINEVDKTYRWLKLIKEFKLLLRGKRVQNAGN
jgi:soluble lytic murein transglycosylase